MHDRRRLIEPLMLLLVVLSGCAPAGDPARRVAGAGAAPAAALELPAAGPPAGTFRLTAAQARDVATVVAFLGAYNAGDLTGALTLLADRVQISDCDHRAVGLVVASGRDQAAAWLRDRLADHDQLIPAELMNENPDQRGTGAHVVGVTYARRTSDSLRALGFPGGIRPQLATKVVLTQTGDQIRGFANGPYGGSPEACRPRAA